MTGMVMYQYVSKEHSSIFSSAWSCYETFHSSEEVGDKTGNSASSCASSVAMVPPSPAKSVTSSKGVAKPKCKSSSDKSGDLTSLLSSCTKLKVRYHAICSKSTLLEAEVAKDIKWSWAANSSNIGVLADQITSLKKKVDDSKMQCLVLQEARELRASMGDESLKALCQSFVALTADIVACENTHSKLLGMYKAFHSPRKA